MAVMTKNEYDHLPEREKRDAIWEWLENVDRSIGHLNGNMQLLHERLRKLEIAAESKG